MPASRSRHTSPSVSHEEEEEGEDEDEEQHYHRHQQDSLLEASGTRANNGEPLSADPSDPKRSRACEACRGLKVRCEPAVDDGPCARCKKAGRQCVVTAPSRKRQRKTDSRVSELERKIDALTASLHAKNTGAATASDGTARESPLINRHPSIPEAPRRDSADRQAVPSRPPPPPSSSSYLPPPRSSTTTPAANASPSQPPLVTAGQKRKASERSYSQDKAPAAPSIPPSVPWGQSLEPDVVDRGVLTMDLAVDLFARFKDRMVPHLPLIAFPPSLTVAELRKTQPMLFLAIMTAAASDRGALQKALQRELLPILAERVFLTCDKSLDLVQSLLISTAWYCPPDNFEDLKFYQLVHTAAISALDIGLGRRSGPITKKNVDLAVSWQSQPFRRHPHPDSTSIESRRTWLVCFFMTSNAAVALRRPNLLRWTPFMAESVEILENSPDAVPLDKYLCHLVWTHRLTEDLVIQFNLEDPSVMTDVNDPRSQHILKALERDFEKYKASVPKEYMRPSLTMSFSMVNLWIHEIVLHNKSVPDHLRPPFNADTFENGIVSLEPLSSAQISAISACISAADSLFTTFLSLDTATIRCLPAFSFVRVAYCLVILIKLYFSVSKPGSELGRIVDKDSLKVEYYLGALQDKFRLAAANDGSRIAVKFMVVLAMLGVWLAKQVKASGGPGAAGETSSQPASRTQSSAQKQQQRQQQQQQVNENTPLQLLSEVAAGTDTDHPRASGPYANPRHASQPFYYDTASTSTTSVTSDMPRSGFQPSHPTDATGHQPQGGVEMPSWMVGDSFILNNPSSASVGEDGAFNYSMGFAPDAQMTFDQGAVLDSGADLMGLNTAFFSDMFMGVPERTHFFPF